MSTRQTWVSLGKAGAHSQHDRLSQVRAATGSGELTISLRSVNHRGLDLHFHQSSEFRTV